MVISSILNSYWNISKNIQKLAIKPYKQLFIYDAYDFLGRSPPESQKNSCRRFHGQKTFLSHQQRKELINQIFLISGLKKPSFRLLTERSIRSSVNDKREVSLVCTKLQACSAKAFDFTKYVLYFSQKWEPVENKGRYRLMEVGQYKREGIY